MGALASTLGIRLLTVTQGQMGDGGGDRWEELDPTGEPDAAEVGAFAAEAVVVCAELDEGLKNAQDRKAK